MSRSSDVYKNVKFQGHDFHIMNSVKWVRKYSINGEDNELYLLFDAMYQKFLEKVYEKELYEEYRREGKKISLKDLNITEYTSKKAEKYNGRFTVYVLVYPGESNITLKHGVDVIKGQAIAFVTAQQLKLKKDDDDQIDDFYKKIIYLSEIMKMPDISGGAALILFNYLYSPGAPWYNRLIFLEVNPNQTNVEGLKKVYLEWGFVPSWMCFTEDVLRNSLYLPLNVMGEFLENERINQTLAYTKDGKGGQTILMSVDNDQLRVTNHIFIFFPLIKLSREGDATFINRIADDDKKFNTPEFLITGLFRGSEFASSFNPDSFPLKYPLSVTKQRRTTGRISKSRSLPVKVEHLPMHVDDELSGGGFPSERIIEPPLQFEQGGRQLTLEEIGDAARIEDDDFYPGRDPPFPTQNPSQHTRSVPRAAAGTKRRVGPGGDYRNVQRRSVDVSPVSPPREALLPNHRRSMPEIGGSAGVGGGGGVERSESYNDRKQKLIDGATDKAALIRDIDKQNQKLKIYSIFERFYKHEWRVIKVNRYNDYVHNYSFAFEDGSGSAVKCPSEIRFKDIVLDPYIFQRKAMMAIIDYHNLTEPNTPSWLDGTYTNLNALKRLYDDKSKWGQFLKDTEIYPFVRYKQGNEDRIEIKRY